MSWGNPQTTGEKIGTALLSPAAAGYAAGLYARQLAYNLQIVKQKDAGVPVISIGNITCGGTGKTPVTIDLARRLIAARHKVGVLSRGYKRQSKDAIVVVSDGRGNIVDCTESGDEPYLIAKSVPEAVVIVGSRRIETAPLAVQNYGCDILLLDDGFQHLAIARDKDIVLVDYRDDLANDRLLPAGRLREPLTALARAQWVVITKVPESADNQRLERIKQTIGRYAPQAQISACRMAGNSFEMLDSGAGAAVRPISALAGLRVGAFCAIARPERFMEQLSTAGAQVVSELHFADHHWYTAEDIEQIRRMKDSASGVDLIVTTEKDAVKLDAKLVADLPIAVLKQELEWLGAVPV